MAELKIISYEPRLKASILALSLAILFLVVIVYKFSEMPTPMKVLVTILSPMAIFASLWNLTKGRKVSKAMREFERCLRVENEVLKLPRKMKIKKAKLEIRKNSTDDLTSFSFDSGDEEFELNEIPLSPSECGGVIGKVYPEIVKFDCYEIKEFETISGSLVVCPIKYRDYEIFIEKPSLFVSERGDHASVELKVENNTIRGRLTYSKSGSRSAKVEIEASYKLPRLLKPPGHVLKEEIIKVSESGTFEFKYRFPRVKDTFLVFYTGDAKITPRSIMKILGFNAPIVFGSGWENLNVKIRLVLDYSTRPDKTDETRISIKPS